MSQNIHWVIQSKTLYVLKWPQKQFKKVAILKTSMLWSVLSTYILCGSLYPILEQAAIEFEIMLPSVKGYMVIEVTKVKGYKSLTSWLTEEWSDKPIPGRWLLKPQWRWTSRRPLRFGESSPCRGLLWRASQPISTPLWPTPEEPSRRPHELAPSGFSWIVRSGPPGRPLS